MAREQHLWPARCGCTCPSPVVQTITTSVEAQAEMSAHHSANTVHQMLPNYRNSLWFGRRASENRGRKYGEKNEKKKKWGKRNKTKQNKTYLCCSMTRSSFIIVLNCLHSSATADRTVFSSHIVKVLFIFGYINIFIILIKYTLPFCFPLLPFLISLLS